jgi:alpha-D-xyloside xylohydrolase
MRGKPGGAAVSDIAIAGGKLRVEVIDDAIVHVIFTNADTFSTRPSVMILPQQVRDEPLVERGNDFVLRTEKLQLRIDRQTGNFTWLDADGEVLLRDAGKQLEPVAVERRVFDANVKITTESTADGLKARVANSKVVIDRTAYQTKLDLIFAEGEAIYGLGQHEEGILNYRGHAQFLYHQNLKVAMPAIVSTRGYGILWDTSSLAAFHEDVYGSYLWTDVDDEMDFYFVVGPGFDDIVKGFRKLTGKPTMFPRWAFGYVQSKERYRTQAELLEVVREYRERQIPLDCIVQDWCTWTGKWWGDKNPDKDRFPDPSQLVNDLHAMNAKLMVSIWPVMRGECPNQVEMRGHGFLLGNDATYNAFDADARALYWKQANDGWFRHGVDGWWCDCTEPFEADWKGTIKPEPWRRAVINTNESKTFLDPEHINEYSMYHSRGIYEHQRAATNEKRVVNLTRSGFPGQHRYGAITWSGDTTATWDTFRRQIADGLNFTVTGNPRWTLDIGGFFVDRKEQWFWRGDYPDGCTDPAYRELYVRWFQLGAFLPMFRSHGTDTPREVWRFGSPGDVTYDTLLRFLHLRYRLLPYIYSLAAWETLFDYTMLRMLAFNFREDPKVYDIADQFMFGPALMICPVTHPAAKSRSVYLPAGTWYDFWTGEKLEGGRTIEAAAPVEILPLFVRAGSILPMGPIVQHSGEGLYEPLEVRVYRGADGEFTLYEDDNDGYAYERGEYRLTKLAWNDAAEKFDSNPPRRLRVVPVHPGHGVGIEETR